MFIRKPICEFIAFGHKNQNLETTQRGSVGEWINGLAYSCMEGY